VSAVTCSVSCSAGAIRSWVSIDMQ
jgi:hypothetical protein